MRGRKNFLPLLSIPLNPIKFHPPVSQLLTFSQREKTSWDCRKSPFFPSEGPEYRSGVRVCLLGTGHKTQLLQPSAPQLKDMETQVTLQLVEFMTVSQTFLLLSTPKLTLGRKGLRQKSDPGKCWAVFSMLLSPVVKLVLNLPNASLLCPSVSTSHLILKWDRERYSYSFSAPPRLSWSLLTIILHPSVELL